MKRFLCLSLIIISILAFTGCGSKSDTTEEETTKIEKTEKDKDTRKDYKKTVRLFEEEVYRYYIKNDLQGLVEYKGTVIYRWERSTDFVYSIQGDEDEGDSNKICIVSTDKEFQVGDHLTGDGIIGKDTTYGEPEIYAITISNR